MCLGASLVVLLLLTFFLKFDNRLTYLVGFFLASLAALGMIFGTRVLHEQTPKMKEPFWISFLADVSYGMYLFHWPLYILFSEVMSNGLAVLCTTILSLVFSSLSFYILEPLLIGKPVKILSWDLTWSQVRLSILATSGLLVLLALGITLTAPKRGAFETDMLVNSLRQADTKMGMTRTYADKQKASKYDVAKGVTVIGDSVTLRATDALSQALPDAQLDAAGSRNLTQAAEILKTNISNKTLLKNVVIATGVNIVYNYEEELDKIVKTLPKGYSLILVTPYDGNSASYDNPVAEKTYKYEKKLADKYEFITLADWNKVSREHPELWEGSDNIHFGGTGESIQAGAKVYAETIQKALKEAENKPVKQ